MKTKSSNGVTHVDAQNEVVIPDLSVKDLLNAIPYVLFRSRPHITL